MFLDLDKAKRSWASVICPIAFQLPVSSQHATKLTFTKTSWTCFRVWNYSFTIRVGKAQVNICLGYVFTLEKYMFKVLFERHSMRMISQLEVYVAHLGIYDTHFFLVSVKLIWHVVLALNKTISKVLKQYM